MKSEKPREIAAHVLLTRGGGADFVEELMERALRQSQLSGSDRGLAQEMVFGVVRWQKTLDWLIGKKTQGRKQPKAVQNLLRLGLYQLFWLDRVPDHAAVDETVQTAKQWAGPGQVKFINAVLRGYARERAAAMEMLAEARRTQPPIGYSHPEWLCRRWQERFGNDRMRRLLEWNNTPPKIFARINRLKTDAAALAVIWQKEGVDALPYEAPWIDQELFAELKKTPPLASLESFRAGYFYMQDPSTALAVKELGAQPGETILDSCAAPGGKATLIAQQIGNQGRIIAEDLNPQRLKMLQENCQRLGADCVQTGFPGAHPVPVEFDGSLVDAPCSNTGVMRRRVELRWRIREEEFTRLRSGQLELLRAAAERIRPGGILVYSTCSLEREENESVKEEFLAGHVEFKAEAERALTPMEDGIDGAYVVRFRRKGRE